MLCGENAIAALQTTISSLPTSPSAEFWPIFFFRLFAELLELSMLDKSSLWK
jgi:hypothetical protein